MVQFLSVIFFWGGGISSIFVGFFKSSRLFVTLYFVIDVSKRRWTLTQVLQCLEKETATEAVHKFLSGFNVRYKKYLTKCDLNAQWITRNALRIDWEGRSESLIIKITHAIRSVDRFFFGGGGGVTLKSHQLHHPHKRLDSEVTPHFPMFLVSSINIKHKKGSVLVTGPVVAQRVGIGIALPFHDHGTRRGWLVRRMPRPYFIPGERPGTHCTGGWVGLRAGLDGRKTSPRRYSIHGPSSPQSVAIPTELPGPPLHKNI